VRSIDTDTGTLTESDTDVSGRTDYRLDDGDHERFSHYADKDKIMEAMVAGTPVVALCGKVWVPSRDPKKFPICPECQRLYDLGPEGRMRGGNEHAADSS
jgi:hypothetical protein